MSFFVRWRTPLVPCWSYSDRFIVVTALGLARGWSAPHLALAALLEGHRAVAAAVVRVGLVRLRARAHCDVVQQPCAVRRPLDPRTVAGVAVRSSGSDHEPDRPPRAGGRGGGQVLDV